MIACNYPIDCSAQLFAYRCRLHVSSLLSETTHHMDFFVIPGAENTISSNSLQGFDLFKTTFPFHSASSNPNVLSTTPDGPPPQQCVKLNPPVSPPLEERVDYTSELLTPMNPPATTPTHIDISPNELIETAASLQYRPVRFLTSLINDRDLWASPPLRKAIPQLMLWRQENGRYYGQTLPFLYDNCADMPIIPIRMVNRLQLRIQTNEIALPLRMGYTNFPFHARLFCMVYITLPGETSMKQVP